MIWREAQFAWAFSFYVWNPCLMIQTTKTKGTTLIDNVTKWPRLDPIQPSIVVLCDMWRLSIERLKFCWYIYDACEIWPTYKVIPMISGHSKTYPVDYAQNFKSVITYFLIPLIWPQSSTPSQNTEAIEPAKILKFVIGVGSNAYKHHKSGQWYVFINLFSLRNNSHTTYLH